MEKKDLQKIAELVVKELAGDIESRNDDKRLTFRVLSKVLTGNDKARVLSLRMDDLRRLPSFAHITRVRARIQNDLRQYLPTLAEVRRKRRINEEVWRNYITGTEIFPQIRPG